MREAQRPNRQYMKALVAFVALMPSIGMAAAYGGAQGTNKRGETIYIDGDIPEAIAVRKHSNDPKWSEQYPLLEECPTFSEAAKQFSCLSNGKSPLAGTTYRVTTSKTYRPCDQPPYDDKSAGQVYLCIEGCNNPRAPKIFYVTPWEC